MCILLDDMKGLGLGKKAWNHFTAGCSYFPLLRHIGHKGISITHYAFDRLLLEPLMGMFGARHNLYYSEHGPDLGDEGFLFRLTDWVVGTGCAGHDLSNSLKWAMAPHSSDPVIKDLHVCIESLRNSFADLHRHIPLFLRRYISFETPPDDADNIAEFWRSLGVDPTFIDTFVLVKPNWQGGRLCVDAALQHRPDCIQLVTQCMLYAMKWVQFNETRWCSVGPACRSLQMSLSVGLEQLVGLTRQDPHSSDYYLHGCRFAFMGLCCTTHCFTPHQ
jgi:hypothetical protein